MPISPTPIRFNSEERLLFVVVYLVGVVGVVVVVVIVVDIVKDEQRNRHDLEQTHQV